MYRKEIGITIALHNMGAHLGFQKYEEEEIPLQNYYWTMSGMSKWKTSLRQ